ncbi:cytochrome c oxidase subunit II [Dyella monticola]|uniref:Cytochrome c oxidase subunit 2 n=1 Tax=Dyella monticola TaxID=1927958 RepID=A0A370WXU0_9GAMM|nr:cytochrome c oxidase subunit II [Dyella monticola]RDS80795.1 cytochrome c oxidase subunit II [Dyella monticola]
MSLSLPEASNFAVPIDRMFNAMLVLCGGVTLGVFVVMFWFCIKYRRGSDANREGRHSTKMGLELSWMLIPFLLFVGIFAWSINLWTLLRRPPAGAMPVYIVAKQWMWKVQHVNGRREIDTLTVPLGVPVRLIMTSQDVIHSFYIPDFRVKQDVVPGRYTALWFVATRLGNFPLFCSEYCGTDHAAMTGTVKVVSREDYQKWLKASTALPPAEQGRQLFVQFGCSGCHDPGSGIRAPVLRGVYGSTVTLADGVTVTADDRYLHDAIVLPATQVVAGYAPIMPTYQSRIDEEDVLLLMAYIKSLGPQASPAQTGVTHAQR